MNGEFVSKISELQVQDAVVSDRYVMFKGKIEEGIYTNAPWFEYIKRFLKFDKHFLVYRLETDTYPRIDNTHFYDIQISEHLSPQAADYLLAFTSNHTRSTAFTFEQFSSVVNSILDLFNIDGLPVSIFAKDILLMLVYDVAVYEYDGAFYTVIGDTLPDANFNYELIINHDFAVAQVRKKTSPFFQFYYMIAARSGLDINTTRLYTYEGDDFRVSDPNPNLLVSQNLLDTDLKVTRFLLVDESSKKFAYAVMLKPQPNKSVKFIDWIISDDSRLVVDEFYKVVDIDNRLLIVSNNKSYVFTESDFYETYIVDSNDIQLLEGR